MLKAIKKYFSKNTDNQKNDKSYQFTWHDIGADDNPFNKKVLDIRDYTWNVISVAENELVADKYAALRQSDGKELTATDVSHFAKTPCDLVYPHNGQELSGPAYKSDCMESKWDIYVYQQIFYFAHSWTGELVFKAHAEISSSVIKIFFIEFDEALFIGGSADVINAVHFIISSHAMGKIIPHPVPSYLEDATPTLIAALSFKMFGKFACYATMDGILDLKVNIE